MSALQKKEIYKFTKGAYEAYMYVDHSWSVKFIKMEFPNWAKLDDKEKFLDEAEKRLIDFLDKEFEVGV